MSAQRRMRCHTTRALRQPRRVGVGGSLREGAGAHGRPDKCMHRRLRPSPATACQSRRYSWTSGGACVLHPPRCPPRDEHSTHTRISRQSSGTLPGGCVAAPCVPSPLPPFSFPPLRWFPGSTAGSDVQVRHTLSWPPDWRHEDTRGWTKHRGSRAVRAQTVDGPAQTGGTTGVRRRRSLHRRSVKTVAPCRCQEGVEWEVGR